MIRRRLYGTAARGFFVFTLLLMLLSQGWVSFSSWPGIKGKLVPELDRKALSIGSSLATKIARALDYGIPLEGLTGVDLYFDEILRQTEGISYLALSHPDGRLIVGKGVGEKALQTGISAAFREIEGNPGKPVSIELDGGALNRDGAARFRNTSAKVLQHEEIEVALVHVGVDPGYAERKVADLKYDVVIVLLASLLVGFEILLAVLSVNFITPLKNAAERIERMAGGDFRRSPSSGGRDGGGVAAALCGRLERIADRANGMYERLQAAVLRLPQGLSPSPASTVLGGLRSKFRFDAVPDAASAGSLDIVRVRILTFVFMFASMLSRPFLPVYLREIADQSSMLPPELSASIPITVYLAVMALSMPHAGRLSHVHGRRRSYMLGVVLMAAGLCGTVLAWNFWALVVARSIEGIGYACLFMSCQGYVVDNTSAENRSSGIAMFVSAIMVSEVCAPAVGGVLADSMGFQGVLAVAALLTLLALPLAWKLLPDALHGASADAGGDAPATDAAGRGAGGVLRNYRFMAISVFAAVPAKLLHSGFLIFLTPVVLSKFGSSTSEIGRFAIVYGVIALIAMPVFSRIGDRHRCHFLLLITGGLIAGAGMLPIVFEASPSMALIGIIGLGLGQAMSIPSQLTLITRTVSAAGGGGNAGSALGVFRLIERVGGALGPLVAGVIALRMGAVPAVAVLGGVMIASILICFLMMTLPQSGGRRAAHDS